MKVIITGATGFIGRNLAGSLHDDGVDVLATGRNQQVGAELARAGIGFQPADLLDPSRLGAVFGPADCVIHCAGKSGDWGHPSEFHRGNVIATHNVIEACRRESIPRVVFISTPSIYFDGTDRLNVSESDPLPPSPSHYAATKLAAERELLGAPGIEVISLRPRAVHGPHDTTFAPRIQRMARRRRFPLINGGAALTDITYIENLVEAVRACLTAASEAWNRSYNISNGEPISIRDWFAAMLDALGQPFRPKNVPERAARLLAVLMEGASRLPFGPQEPPFTRFSVGYMARSMTLSIERARRCLGYEPAVSNREGFARYARWCGRRGG